MRSFIFGLAMVLIFACLSFAGEKEDLSAEKNFLERQIMAIQERMQLLQVRFEQDKQDRATAFKRLGAVETRLGQIKKEEAEKEKAEADKAKEKPKGPEAPKIEKPK